MRTTLIVAFLVVMAAVAQAAWIPDSSWSDAPQHHQKYDTPRSSHHEALPKSADERIVDFTEQLATWTGVVGGATVLLFAATSVLAFLAYLQSSYFARKERAFVFEETVDVSTEHGHDGGARGIEFAMVFKNTGGTPTHLMHYRVTHELRDTPLPVDFDFTNKANEEDLLAVLGPDGRITAPPILIHIFDMDAVRRGTKHLYLWGWVEYYDRFWLSPRHRTEVCLKVGVRGASVFEGTISMGMIVHSAHNGADDECAGRIHTFPPKHPHSWWRKTFRHRQLPDNRP